MSLFTRRPSTQNPYPAELRSDNLRLGHNQPAIEQKLKKSNNKMIEELLISNVRLFEGPEEWRIPLSGLTVFCGTNSAGKSTILKTLLLICQTNSDADAPSRVGRLRLG